MAAVFEELTRLLTLHVVWWFADGRSNHTIVSQEILKLTYEKHGEKVRLGYESLCHTKISY